MKGLLKAAALALTLLFIVPTQAQIYQKFPTNIRYIGGGFNNVRPFFKTLETALNDVKAVATVSNPYGFWIASDTLWIADWDSVFTASGLTMKDSIDVYYVSTGKIKWMPFGFGGTGGSGGTSTIIVQDDITLHYDWPTWDQTNLALPLWQRNEGVAMDSADEEVWRLIVYTETPLYIENDTLKIDTTGLQGADGAAGWQPDTTTVVRTTGNQSIAGNKTLTGVSSVTGTLQLPATDVTPSTARALWGSATRLYYSGSGAVDDTSEVVFIDYDTRYAEQDTFIVWGNLSSDVQDSINAWKGVGTPHGFLDAASDTPAVTQNVYTKITPTFSTDLAGLTSAGDSVTVSAGADGDYYMSVVFTNQNAATDDFTLQIRKNNTSIHSVRFTGAGASAFVAVSTMHYEELVAGDDLSLYITNTANGNDPVITEIDWFIYRVHE